MRQGSDVTIIACGIMVATALEAAESLGASGVECRVLNMATLQPLDEGAITEAASETAGIVTAEEHYRYGGLGSLVAQTVARASPVPVEVVAQDRYAESGKPEQLLAKYGLATPDIEKAVRSILGRKRSGLAWRTTP